jgi:hypothetical protein
MKKASLRQVKVGLVTAGVNASDENAGDPLGCDETGVFNSDLLLLVVVVA